MAEPSLKDLAYRGLAATLGGPVDLSAGIMSPSSRNLYMTPIEQAQYIKDSKLPAGEYAPINDGRQNLGGGIFSRIDDKLSKSQIYQGIKDAITAPGRAYRGELDPFSPAGMEDAVNFAFNVGSGGIATTAVKPVPGKTLGMFIGKRARTWNAVMASKAKDMERAGVDPRIIWKETGTWKGPDGKWRQEINDSVSRPGHTLYSLGESADLKAGDSTVVRRQKALLHPPLSAAYPDTKNIGVNIRPGREGGLYYHDYDNINVGASKDNFAANRSTMLHELQHAIQQREGFASGGSPEIFKLPDNLRQGMHKYEDMARAEKLLDRALREGVPVSSLNPRWADDSVRAIASQYEKTNNGIEMLRRNMEEVARIEDPYGAYQRLAGEAEARATQARSDMTAAKRRETFPEESYDVPISDLIIRQGGGKSMSAPDYTYRGRHTAPSPEFGAPLHDLTGGGQMYPADVYSPKAAQYYGTGYPQADKEAFALAHSVRGNPEATVTMYRAVPKDEKIASINAGDWVSLSKDYAKEHGQSVLKGDYKIISKKVKAKELYTNADSIHEFGYWPSKGASKSVPERPRNALGQTKATYIKDSAHAQTVSDDIYNLANASGLDVAFERSPAWGSQYMTITHPDGRVLRVRVADHANKYGGNDVYIDPSSASVEEGVSAIRQAFPELLAKMPAGQGKRFISERFKAMQDAEMFMLKNAKGTQPAELYPLVNKIGEATSRAEIARLQNELEGLIIPKD